MTSAIELMPTGPLTRREKFAILAALERALAELEPDEFFSEERGLRHDMWTASVKIENELKRRRRETR